MNYLTANLMLYINSERGVFWTLVQIMNKFNWREIFTDGTPKLFDLLDLFFKSFKVEVKVLYEYYESIDFIDYLKGIVTHLFVTIFCYNVYAEYSSRILDYFFLKGEDVILDSLIYLLKISTPKLLKLNFDESAYYLKSNFVNDCIQEYGVINCLPYTVNDKLKLYS